MRLTSVLALAAVGAAMLPAGAQTPAPQARVFMRDNMEQPAEHRAALGIATASTGSPRDTLGLMVTAVTKGSPAERAGIEEGNRIAAINGVSLRAGAADVEDAEMSGMLSHRLIRELGKAKPGDEVELRVYRDGRTSAVKVRTADSDSLFRRREVVRITRAEMEDRPVLGLGISSTGNRRDTLGVFVSAVSDSSPAARAGIEEGNRIAAINGVSLRVSNEDAGDQMMGGMKAQRLQREILQLKAGSDVTLRVYANGQFRDVHLKAARAGDLPKDRNRMMFLGGHEFEGFGMKAPMPPMMPMMPMMPMEPTTPGMQQRVKVMKRTMSPSNDDIRVEIGPEMRKQLEQVRREVKLLGPEMESIGPALERMRPEMERIRLEIPRAVRQAREAALNARFI